MNTTHEFLRENKKGKKIAKSQNEK